MIGTLGLASMMAVLISGTDLHADVLRPDSAAQMLAETAERNSASEELESANKSDTAEPEANKQEDESEQTGPDSDEPTQVEPTGVAEADQPAGVTEGSEPTPSDTDGEARVSQGEKDAPETGVDTEDSVGPGPSNAQVSTGSEDEKPEMITEEAKSAGEQTREPPPEIELEQERPTGVQVINLRALTTIEPGHNDSDPVWSPSGEMVAFERGIDDRQEIIISRLDGSVIHRIYHQAASGDEELEMLFPGIDEDVSYNAGLSWSPDGKSLVFMSNGGNGNYDLYLLPEFGKTTPVRLTEHSEKDSHPDWSPVANELVFVSGRTGKADIYLMRLDTRETTKLTTGEKSYFYPQWSPDGRQIAMTYGSNENHDVYLIRDLTRPIETLSPLTTWAYDDLRPVWSPDGKRIAFYTNYNEENDPKVWSLAVIAADGSEPGNGGGLAAKVVATNIIPDVEKGPAWMPDSRRIVYVKNDREAYNPIYMVNIENKSNLLLQTGAKMNHDVTCSVNGRIAFRAQVEQWDHIHIAELGE